MSGSLGASNGKLSVTIDLITFHLKVEFSKIEHLNPGYANQLISTRAAFHAAGLGDNQNTPPIESYLDGLFYTWFRNPFAPIEQIEVHCLYNTNVEEHIHELAEITGIYNFILPAFKKSIRNLTKMKR